MSRARRRPSESGFARRGITPALLRCTKIIKSDVALNYPTRQRADQTRRVFTPSRIRVRRNSRCHCDEMNSRTTFRFHADRRT